MLQNLIVDEFAEDQIVKKFASDPQDETGVQLGGFRQASYSDSHKEIVKTVSRLSAEDIQLLGSASKKEHIDIYRSHMKQVQQPQI